MRCMVIVLADSSTVRFQTLPLRLRSSIPSAVADFTYMHIPMFKKLSCVNLYVRP